MAKISLIVIDAASVKMARATIEDYSRALEGVSGVASVEVIVAGGLDPSAEPGRRRPLQVIHPADGPVGLLIDAVARASGDALVIVDAGHGYAPDALAEAARGWLAAPADVAVGVSRSGFVRGVLGSLSRALLGTADASSGLLVVRRPDEGWLAETRYRRSRALALEVLSWPEVTHGDVAVSPPARPGWVLRLRGIDDLRLLKRRLDARFGTVSRLVQFCMVGASGMVVDLSLYALLQWLFGRLGFFASGAKVPGFSWPLAVAGAVSILSAMAWNFTLNRRLTFNDSRAGSIGRQLATYALGNALGIGVSLFLRLYLPLRFGFFARHKLAAAVVGIVAATGISFSMSRWVVFIRRPEPDLAARQARLHVESVL